LTKTRGGPATIAEKILSAHCGRPCYAGESVVCRVDAAMATDGSAPMAIDYFRGMGGEKLADPKSLIFALDHYAPPDNPATVALQDRIRKFSTEQGNVLYDIGAGIGHQLMIERGHVRPGDLVVGADSHAVAYGAANAFAVGVGSSDLAAVMLTGKLWFRVPESIRIELIGKLPASLDAKDIALEINRTLDPQDASYRVLEFTGEGAVSLTFEERMLLSNMSTDAGAKAGVFDADSVTTTYLKNQDGLRHAVTADEGAVYAKHLSIDLNTLTPRLARPPVNGQAAEIVELGQDVDTPVDMVYLGTCTGGRQSDLESALRVLRAGGGKHPRVQLVVTPASDRVYAGLAADGMLEEFIRMGALMMTPGCGSCCGTCGAIPGDEKVVISAANRNFTGRMGNPKARVFLASPAACAAAAVTGKITDPRTII
tara:strand:- start:30169 stop:31449 length:1281 start_codon:yes stop_codon:yes gene_type:complete